MQTLGDDCSVYGLWGELEGEELYLLNTDATDMGKLHCDQGSVGVENHLHAFTAWINNTECKKQVVEHNMLWYSSYDSFKNIPA